MSRRQDRELALTCPHCGKPAERAGVRCDACGKEIGEGAIANLGHEAKMRNERMIVEGHLAIGADKHAVHECAKCGAKAVPVENKCPYCHAPAAAKRVVLNKELHVHGTLEIKGGSELVIRKK